MTTLHLAKGLDLPLSTAIAQKYCFTGRSGTGKTYGAMKLCELMLDAGAQVVVLDLVGVWWGLKAGADGKPGISVPVFGGEHGDIPLNENAGELVADLIVDRSLSVVLDVSGFTMAAMRRFALALVERFYHRKKTARSAVHLFLEEAQELVPEHSKGDSARLVGAMQRLIKIGRNFGAGFTLITQRPQAVSKDVLNQTEALFVGQMNGAHERKALKSWIVDQSGNTDLVDELPQLPVGTMYLWSPQWLKRFEKIQIAKKRTADVSATPTFGAKSAEPRALAKVDLEQLRSVMATAVEEKEANDPKALKKRIVELERLIAAGGTVETKVVERVVAIDRDLVELRAMLDGAHDLAKRIDATLAPARNASGLLVTAGHPDRPGQPKHAEPNTPPRKPAMASRSIGSRIASQATDREYFELGKCGRTVLAVLAHRRGKTSTDVDVAILAGYAHDGGGFRNALGALRSAGRIVGSSSGIEITNKGLETLGPLPKALSRRELLDLWKAKLGKAARLILDHVATVFPHASLIEEIASDCGYAADGGGFRNALGELRSLRLISQGNQPRLHSVFEETSR